MESTIIPLVGSDNRTILHIGMSANELLESFHQQGIDHSFTKREIDFIEDKSILSRRPPISFVLPTPAHSLSIKTPTFIVKDKSDAFSPQLQEFCSKHPIVLVEGLASALELDLELFSTETLLQLCPEQGIEVRTQILQPSDENWNVVGGACRRTSNSSPMMGTNSGNVSKPSASKGDPTSVSLKKSWHCPSARNNSNIATYAKYQVPFLQDDLQARKKMKLTKTIKFGTNIDLLPNDPKYTTQLEELQKLPHFTRVESNDNMLGHVGYSLLGMNTVQLYMKVPGCRTPGHQENNNFCSINVNIGPGDCEWFAVPDLFWTNIQKLCERNGINYLHGSWWPNVEEVKAEGIPVFKFIQKPGDLVWVNCGCVHWVQAIGSCNNIAWNVGPITALQYQIALERYDWNKTQNFKSIVPMVQLSWNLARKLQVTDELLFKLIKTSLMKSLVQCTQVLEYVQARGMEVKFHGKQEGEAAEFCAKCYVEVFNILFARKQEKRYVVHCLECAEKYIPRTRGGAGISPATGDTFKIFLKGFVCLVEYKMEELMKIYDQFVLHPVLPNSTYSEQQQQQQQQESNGPSDDKSNILNNSSNNTSTNTTVQHTSQ